MGPSLLVVVLHYSGLDDTLECVDSLVRQTYQNMQIVVVDNNSREKARGPMAMQYPRVEVFELAENRGWSGGNNAGIRLAMERSYDVVCLLNNDTVVPEDCLGRLMQAAAFLEPSIFHPAIDSYAAGEAVQLDPNIPQPRDLKSSPVPGCGGLFEISCVNGSCLLAHVDVFRNIGLIDERFFLLCEDADIGARARAAGYRFFCATAARIRHKESRAFGGRRVPIKAYYGIRNMLLFWEKHGVHSPVSPAWLRGVAWLISGNARASGAGSSSAGELLRWTFSDDPFARAVRMGLRDYVMRRFGRINARDEALLGQKTAAD